MFSPHTNSHLQALLKKVLEASQIKEALTPKHVAANILAWLQSYRGVWSTPRLLSALKREVEEARAAGLEIKDIAAALTSRIQAGRSEEDMVTYEATPLDIDKLSELLGVPVGTSVGESRLCEKDQTYSLDLKKAPKEKDTDTPDIKPYEQDNPVRDEQDRDILDDLGMQDPDNMPPTKDREDVIIQLEARSPVSEAVKKQGVIRFATPEEAFLWKDEILGQLSDGAWENATPFNHWEAWNRANVEVGTPAGWFGFRPRKTSYGMTRLIPYIGDRMRTHLGLMKMLKAKGIPEANYTHWALPDDLESYHTAVNAAEKEKASGTSDLFWRNTIQRWNNLGITEEMVREAEKTSEKELRSILQRIQKTMKIELSDEPKGTPKAEEPKTPEVVARSEAPKEAPTFTPRPSAETPAAPAFTKESKDTKISEGLKSIIQRKIQADFSKQLSDAADELGISEDEIVSRLAQRYEEDLENDGDMGTLQAWIVDNFEYALDESKVPTKPAEANQEQMKKDLLETEDVKKLYANAGLPVPDGKGVHTKAFHELAIKIAKSYVKSGDTPKKAMDKAYPTAMKQLGTELAVKKPHWASTKESNQDSSEDAGFDDVCLKFQEALDKAFGDVQDGIKDQTGDKWNSIKGAFYSKAHAVVQEFADMLYPYAERPTGTVATSAEEGKAPDSTDTADKAMQKLLEQVPEGIDAEQLAMGIKVEMEHTDNPEEAKKIALDHLKELPDYYTKLQKMEAGTCDEMVPSWGESKDAKVAEGKASRARKDTVEFNGRYYYVYQPYDVSDARKIERELRDRDIRVTFFPEVQVHLTDTLKDVFLVPLEFVKKAKEYFGESKVQEGTGPDLEQYTVTEEDLAILKKAIRARVIPHGYPSDEEMFKQLQAVEPERISLTMPAADLKMMYLKYVLIPKAIAYMKESKAVQEQEQIEYELVADNIIDQRTADDLATKVGGTRATDDNDPKKFKVIKRKV